jgi:hypothetical protein
MFLPGEIQPNDRKVDESGSEREVSKGRSTSEN